MTVVPPTFAPGILTISDAARGSEAARRLVAGVAESVGSGTPAAQCASVRPRRPETTRTLTSMNIALLRQPIRIGPGTMAGVGNFRG